MNTYNIPWLWNLSRVEIKIRILTWQNQQMDHQIWLAWIGQLLSRITAKLVDMYSSQVLDEPSQDWLILRVINTAMQTMMRYLWCHFKKNNHMNYFSQIWRNCSLAYFFPPFPFKAIEGKGGLGTLSLDCLLSQVFAPKEISSQSVPLRWKRIIMLVHTFIFN